MPNTIEYELLAFEFESSIGEELANTVCEDEVLSYGSNPHIERDADGIPMGGTITEIRERETIIKEMLHKWGTENPERKVFNNALEDYIWIKGISVIEAREHSAKSYRSTLAILNIDEVLKNALPVRRLPTKKGYRNQAIFAYMLVMVYRHEEIGTIKVTVGVKSNEQRIEYGITALRPDQPLIEESSHPTKKKRRSQ